MKYCKLLIITLLLISCIPSDNISTNLKAEVFKTRIENEAVQLIDVRTPKEFDAGHINNAININYFSKNFQDSISLLRTELPVFIYCRSGKRSSKSAAIFRAVGFDSIYQLEGGFLKWKSNGFIIERN